MATLNQFNSNISSSSSKQLLDHLQKYHNASSYPHSLNRIQNNEVEAMHVYAALCHYGIYASGLYRQSKYKNPFYKMSLLR